MLLQSMFGLLYIMIMVLILMMVSNGTCSKGGLFPAHN